MQSKAATVDQYLKEIPADRRPAIEAIRKVIRDNIDPDFQERMQYGCIGYSVPHSIYPDGYHCDPKQPLPFAALASQKNYMSLYLGSVYMNPKEEQWFRAAWTKSGRKLDMGKSCIRFKKLEDVPLDVVGEAFRRVTLAGYVRTYQDMRQKHLSKRPAAGKQTASNGKATSQRASKVTPATRSKKLAAPSAKQSSAAAKKKAASTGKTKAKSVKTSKR